MAARRCENLRFLGLLGLPSSVRTRILQLVVLGLLGCVVAVGSPAAAVTAGSFAGAYKVFTSDADFDSGARAGLAASSGSLRITSPVGSRAYAGHSYQYSTWTSPWTTRSQPFTRLVPSWSAGTPTGTWIEVLVQVRNTAGTTSSVKSLGRWASGDSVIKRTSAGTQADAVASVATDTVVAGARGLTAFRLFVKLMRRTGDPSPALAAVGAVTSAPPGSAPRTSLPLTSTAVSLAVPAYSQMVHQGENPEYGGGGEAWCSPTSLSMVLGYYGRLPDRSTYTWVSSSYPQRFVNSVARSTYDHAYDGTGNWPFNTAYAATRVSSAFVTRLADLRMAERFIRVGIPLIVSIRFSQGGLSGAPISATNGHLVVLVGFTAAGNPIVNDPAASTSKTVRHVYNRAQFERAWLTGSAGMAYVLHSSARPLPKRPSGVYAW